AFSFFTPREKHYIAQTLLGETNADAQPMQQLEVDVAVAARAMALEARLITTLKRFGIRGGGQ
ncbi:MAG: hypothetical protein MUD01_26485, partial [Chloroflexaceae bacterium]|nr:hypothetical protein [Chloroflexaceae bacterium]